VAGQAAAVGLILIVLAPLGTGSYVLGDVLRALFPNAKPLRLINGRMLSLIPVLVGARFMFEAPPSGMNVSWSQARTAAAFLRSSTGAKWVRRAEMGSDMQERGWWRPDTGQILTAPLGSRSGMPPE
jgi:hypothetical protein